jgi:CRISPR-associated protein Csm1
MWDNSYKDDRVKGLESILEFSSILEKLHDNKKISKNFLYSMLKLWQENFYDESKNVYSLEQWEYMSINRVNNHSYVPMLKYKISKINDKKTRELFNKDYWKFLPWIRIPVSWVSLRSR